MGSLQLERLSGQDAQATAECVAGTPYFSVLEIATQDRRHGQAHSVVTGPFIVSAVEYETVRKRKPCGTKGGHCFCSENYAYCVTQQA